MNPEKRLFTVSAGQFFEDEAGDARECVPIRPVSRAQLVADLKRNFRFAVALGQNLELALDYIVSARPDGRFTADEVTKIDLLFGRIIVDE